MSPDPTSGAAAGSALRVGVFHQLPLERWQADCLEQLFAVPGTEPVVRIRPDSDAGSGYAGGCALFRLWWRLQRPRAREPVPVPASLEHTACLTGSLAIDPAGVARFPDSIVVAIRQHRLDVVIDLRSALPDAALRDVARYGVWSFQHGAHPEWPPCFAELYQGERIVRSVFRQQSASGDVVLREAVLPVRPHSYSRTVDAVLASCARWPAQVCRELLEATARGRSPATPVHKVAQAPLPASIGMLKFFGRQVGRTVDWLMQLLFQHGHWNVGLVRAPIASFLQRTQLAAVEWLPGPPRGEFVADPFGVSRQGRLTVVCERYPYRTGVGEIAAMVAESLPWVAVDIGPDVHRSYPYLVDHAGDVFCIPETHQTREVALYRAVEFPVRWQKVATLVRNVAALDSTVIQFGGRWWMWFVDADRGSQSELHLWHALHLSGPWSAHPGNPVKIDVRSARPAGTPFVHEGSLYRPAQDCSETYGRCVVLNRVTCLTPAAYAEETVGVVAPDPAGPYPDGLHTLSAVGDVTLVDGKRVIFDWRECYRAVTQLIGWALGKRG